MSKSVQVSYVLTVYNKAEALPLALTFLARDQCDLVCEYIFVDDASTDDSVALLKKQTRDWSRVMVVENKKNKGPSLCLNQGIAMAQGEAVFLLDGDDLLREGSTAFMYQQLRHHKADFVYGGWRRVYDVPTIEPLPAEPTVHVSTDPLAGVLEYRCVGMAVMATRELLKHSGGADERLFVQDQSLALRLGFYARRFLFIDAIVVYAPTTTNALSHNLALQHHDGFYAFNYALNEFQKEERRLYAKMVSVLWKAKRGKVLWWPFFLFYTWVKWFQPKPLAMAWLARCARRLLAPQNSHLSSSSRSA